MATPRIAVACCRRSDDADPTDLYPDGDAGPLRLALKVLGVESTLVSWDDPEVDWASFSHVAVSSTWDSVDRPVEYLRWAASVSAITDLINPWPVLEWNLDKVHQRELAAAGLPVIATTWIAPGEAWEVPDRGEFVVKPSVSAGGRNTVRYLPGDVAARQHVEALGASGQTVMVQDYLAAIDTEGEVDLVFLAGEFSHAVLKKPALQVGAGVIDRPWERMAWSGLTTPSREQFAVANDAVAYLTERFEGALAYGRIDLILGHGGPRILEMELIDPNLSFDMEPRGAARLASAILASPSPT